MRQVAITIGPPVLYQPPQAGGFQDCFCICFTDSADDGFTAQAACLCTLSEATEAWLTGKSAEEVQALMAGHDDSP